MSLGNTDYEQINREGLFPQILPHFCASITWPDEMSVKMQILKSGDPKNKCDCFNNTMILQKEDWFRRIH